MRLQLPGVGLDGRGAVTWYRRFFSIVDAEGETQIEKSDIR